MKFKTVDEILDFAIRKEEEAHDFYMALSKKADKKWISEMLVGFAQEELGHKEKLLGVKKGNLLEPSKTEIMDLKISDYLTDVKPKDEINYQEALIIAMKAEKEAFRLYTDLANTVNDPGLKDTFKALAQEEAKHKLRFEVEYDDFVLTEN